jgi:hypothetical protein
LTLLVRLCLRSGTDDLLGIVRRFICPDCSRAALNRCLKRHHISRLDYVGNRGNHGKDKGIFFNHTMILPPGASFRIHTLLDCMTRYCHLLVVGPKAGGGQGPPSMPLWAGIPSGFWGLSPRIPLTSRGTVLCGRHREKPPAIVRVGGVPHLSTGKEQAGRPVSPYPILPGMSGIRWTVASPGPWGLT